MSIPQHLIEEIREKASIAEFVGETVTLKRSGKNLSGLCPFHAEKTPSFFVNEQEGFFHCFGCGKKGSVYDFVMATKGLTFPESVRLVAKRVGVEVPVNRAVSDRERQMAERRKSLRDVIEHVAELYHQVLCTGDAAKQARSYFRRRGLTKESVTAFRLGYAPEHHFLESALREKLGESVPSELSNLLVEAGVVTRKANGDTYDTFGGRVLFPIMKSDGTVVGFGGRLMADAPNRPKYINSGENLLYHKSKNLFGLPQALTDIRQTRTLYLVEGYMDVIGMWQAGYKNCVATCGTATTPEHVSVMRRFAERVIAVFDGDAAGQRAGAKCFELFINSGIEVQGVALPATEDPASLAQASVEKLGNCLGAVRPIVDCYLDERLQQSGPLESSPAKAGKIAGDVAAILRRVENPAEREILVNRVADRLGLSQGTIAQLLTGKVPQQFRSRPEERKPLPATRVVRKEDENSPSLNPYSKQLAVAVICEPLLAQNVLDMPSIVSEESGNLLAPTVKVLLEHLVRQPPAGLRSLVLGLKAGGSRDEFERGVHYCRALLEQSGLNANEILREAERQMTVGGSSPEKLVENAPSIVKLRGIQAEVEKIRLEEAKEQDMDKRIQLAQEKLLKKRSLERARLGKLSNPQ